MNIHLNKDDLCIFAWPPAEADLPPGAERLPPGDGLTASLTGADRVKKEDNSDQVSPNIFFLSFI